MSLYQRFNLLPPPTRTILSVPKSQDEKRCKFPDFDATPDPVASLEAFLKQFFVPELPRWARIQLILASTGLILIGICGSAILARKLRQKSFWLFRLVREHNGVLVVPNSVASYSLFGAIFSNTLLAACWLLMHPNGWLGTVSNRTLWLTLPWYPLAYGDFFCLVGLLYASPQARKATSAAGKGPRWFSKSPNLTPGGKNLLVVLTLSLHTVAVMIPSVLSGVRFSEAESLFKRWHLTYSESDQLDEEMLIQAQIIWFKTLGAIRYSSIAILMWSLWASTILVVYLTVGVRLILTLRSQIRTLSTFKQSRSFSQSWAVEREEEEEEEKQQRACSSGASPATTSTTTTSSTKKSVTGSTSLEDGQDDGPHRLKSAFFTPQEMEDQNRIAKSFFPPVKPSTILRPPNVCVPKPKSSCQKRYLERFYKNFLFQFVGFSSSFLVNASLSVWMPFSLYRNTELADVVQEVARDTVMMTWLSVVFGSIIMVAMASHTYEPVIQSFWEGVVTTRSSARGRRAAAAPRRASSKPESFKLKRIEVVAESLGRSLIRSRPATPHPPPIPPTTTLTDVTQS
ncbi:hypothetical protein IE53DRAFT_379447 [Violaceomyces palustris]|uniref:Uncharacterized protein n=1 Tax=Violaceomyces palustris TaxID=1673888 RepID=A0ACD0NYC3_9BASI|nr:hypothetical protein IE53DRAFT_379447 [Violaceomyces palustris]